MPEINLDISEGDLKNAIAVAIAEAFTADKRDAMIRDIIRAHMTVKTGRYDKETLLSETVGSAIKAMAVDELKIMIADLEPRVREMVREQLGVDFSDKVLASIKTALSKIVIDNLHFRASLIDD